MGSPKLLLPWRDSTVIEQLIHTLSRPEITAVVVVARPDDLELQAALRRTAAIAVIPDHEPPEMRDSVEIGLRAIRGRFQPRENDGWLLIPADHPLIEPKVLDGLLTSWSDADCNILIPKFGDRRGHPALLRWFCAELIEQLPPDVGINGLWKASPQLITEWPTDHESVLADLDTPEDYARWQQSLNAVD